MASMLGTAVYFFKRKEEFVLDGRADRVAKGVEMQEKFTKDLAAVRAAKAAAVQE